MDISSSTAEAKRKQRPAAPKRADEDVTALDAARRGAAVAEAAHRTSRHTVDRAREAFEAARKALDAAEREARLWERRRDEARDYLRDVEHSREVIVIDGGEVQNRGGTKRPREQSDAPAGMESNNPAAAKRKASSDVKRSSSITVEFRARDSRDFPTLMRSFSLSRHDIAGCIHETGIACSYLQYILSSSEETSITMDNLIKLRSIFLKLEKYLSNDLAKEVGIHSGKYMLDVLHKGGHLTHSNYQIFVRYVAQVCDFIQEQPTQTATPYDTPHLHHFMSCVSRFFSGSKTEQTLLRRAQKFEVLIKVVQGDCCCVHGLCTAART